MVMGLLMGAGSTSCWILRCSRAICLSTSALGDRLEYELTFNDYKRVIKATGDLNVSYTIDNISLEYDMVTQSEFSQLILSNTLADLSSSMTEFSIIGK